METRSTVLVVIKGLGIGGAEKLISEGARYWDRERFDYRVAYQLPWKDQLVPELTSLGVPVDCFGGGGGGSIQALGRLASIIAESGADLVHAHLPSAGVLARICARVPIVYTEHNLAGSYRLPTRLLNWTTYRLNDVVTAVSSEVAASLKRYPGPDPVVVRNGVSVDVSAEDRARARSELGLSPSDPLVVHVGNIRPHKGHDTLIRTAIELQHLHPDATIVSIGGEKHPGDLERVRRQARTAGASNLRFLGRRSDALGFVAAADVFVNPSDIEGLPVAILEAMALETPVAATAVGGVPSVIRDGESGLLVDAGDHEALARSIDRILRDRPLARRLAACGLKLVEAEYGLETMVRSFETIYREVLDD